MNFRRPLLKAANRLAALPRRPAIALLVFSELVIFSADLLTGYETGFAFFYLLPVLYASWRFGNRGGMVMAGFSAMAWLETGVADGSYTSHPVVEIWNWAMSVSVFTVIVFVFAELKRRVDIEHTLARTDPLTGVPNSKYFFELAERELSRCRRHKLPMAVCYVDCDNFKQVNDTRGHKEGDHLLREVVQVMRLGIRPTDVLARVGGDEFVLLLPETAPGDALAVGERIQAAVLATAREHSWPITISMGVANYSIPSASITDMMGAADQLMYRAKQSGKNRIIHESIESSL